MLYSTLLCKKIARAPERHKKFMLSKLGGGGGGGGGGQTEQIQNLSLRAIKNETNFYFR